MDIIYITIPVTLIFIAIAVGIFFWATKNGQYDDMDSPANRILYDEEEDKKPQRGDSTTETGEGSSGGGEGSGGGEDGG